MAGVCVKGGAAGQVWVGAVTAVHKANIMKKGDGMFLKVRVF